MSSTPPTEAQELESTHKRRHEEASLPVTADPIGAETDHGAKRKKTFHTSQKHVVHSLIHVSVEWQVPYSEGPGGCSVMTIPLVIPTYVETRSHSIQPLLERVTRSNDSSELDTTPYTYFGCQNPPRPRDCTVSDWLAIMEHCGWEPLLQFCSRPAAYNVRRLGLGNAVRMTWFDRSPSVNNLFAIKIRDRLDRRMCRVFIKFFSNSSIVRDTAAPRTAVEVFQFLHSLRFDVLEAWDVVNDIWVIDEDEFTEDILLAYC
ncbi:hypothetical protein F4860DRAFT_520965 [Xylaria cubensis]|nr:hypothetical protein F4860DRAFT_520965 [Xylaria cubensis]